MILLRARWPKTGFCEGIDSILQEVDLKMGNYRIRLYVVIISTLVFLLAGLPDSELVDRWIGTPVTKINASENAYAEQINSTNNVASETTPAREQLIRSYANIPFKVVDFSERTYDGGPAIAVTFSVPLDPTQDYASLVSATKIGEGLVKGGWVLSQDGLVLYFPHVEPDTTYSVSVYRTLRSVTGSTLERTYSERVQTRNVEPAVGFAQSGSILPADLSKGLPVITVNVNAVDIDFFRIAPQRIPRFLSNWRKGGLQGHWSIEQWRALGELVYSGRFDLNPPPNKRRTVFIPVCDIKEIKKPGFLAAVMKEAGEYPEYYNTTYFVMSDVGLHLRLYRDQLEAYVASLGTGEPLSGVKISLVGKGGDVLQAGSTSDSGQVGFAGPFQRAQFVLAEKDEQISVVPLKGPILDLSEFDVGERPQYKQELFIYGPRNIYRPGEDAEFAALLRDQDGRLIESIPLHAVVTRPDGVQLKEFTWQPKALGFYLYELKLPADAQTGEWKLNVKTPDDTRHEYKFTVADFMPERLKLSFGVSERIISPEDTLRIPVVASYLYGAPASGNKLTTIVKLRANRFPVPTLKGFQFGDMRERNLSQHFELTEQDLDDQGKGTINVEPEWKEARSPVEVRVIASVLDTGGRPVTRSLKQIVWPAESLIGIRPLFTDDKGQGKPEAYSRAEFEIVKSDAQGNLLAAENLDVRLIREYRNYYWQYNNGRWEPEYSEKHYTSFGQQLSISADERGHIVTPVEWGYYRLEVTDPTTGLLSSIRFRTEYYWEEMYDKEQKLRPDKVAIVLDKPSYKPGDVAQVNIISPHEGRGILMIESDRPLWSKVINVPARGITVEVPVSESWARHDIYLSAMVVRPADASEKNTPKRALGILHLPLDRSDRHLDISINAPEKVEPETQVNLKLEVNRKDGQPLPDKVFITVAAVDAGVLSITDFATPDPFEWFFKQRRYSPEMRDLYANIIEQGEGKVAFQRFGGDAEVTKGGLEPLTQVQIVSLFTGPVPVDSQGLAEVSLNVPYFNGRLRLMALAYGSEHFGHAEREMTVAASIVTDVAMPRFLACGDESTIALELHNVTDQTQTLNVTLEATGPVELESLPQLIGLPPGEKTVLYFPVRARKEFGASEILLEVDNQGTQDPDTVKIKRRWTLGVRPAYPARLKAFSGVASYANPLIVDRSILNGLMPATVEGRMVISNQPPLNLEAHFRSLIQYPYGCLEQITSRAYPLLFASKDNLSSWHIEGMTQRKRFQALEYSLTKISSMQRANGSFGLWSHQSPEEHWLTAYATDFMLTARDIGIEVPKEMLNRALERLLYYAETPSPEYSAEYSDYHAHYTFSYKAYAAYVLSRVNQAPLSPLRLLYDHHRDQAASGLPLVHLGLALRSAGDHRRANEAIKQALIKDRDSHGYLGDYGSPVRDNALTIALLLNSGFQPHELRSVLFKLRDQLSERTELSTQERASLFLAALALRQQESTPWKAIMRVGTESRELIHTGSLSLRYTAEQLRAGVGINVPANNILFYQYEVSGYPDTPPESYSNALRVTRQFRNINGLPIDPSEIRAGEMFLVHLAVHADKKVPNALVVDLLPAGLELEDQNLSHSMRIDDLQVDGKYIGQWPNRYRIAYQEYRDDRYVAAVDMDTDLFLSLFYLVRAVTPGVYHIPASYVEDMYRPYYRAMGSSEGNLRVVRSRAKKSDQ